MDKDKALERLGQVAAIGAESAELHERSRIFLENEKWMDAAICIDQLGQRL